MEDPASLKGFLMADMTLGSEGLKLIQEFETFRSKPYDTDGGGRCTIG